jgi:hypothetical protein
VPHKKSKKVVGRRRKLCYSSVSINNFVERRREKQHKLFCLAGQDNINKGSNKWTPPKTIDPIYKEGSVLRK